MTHRDPVPFLSDTSRSGGWRLERLAWLVGIGLLLGLPAAILVGRPDTSPSFGRAIELVARQPAAGGWSVERIVVNRGDRVRLRIRSEDVVHGFAIGRLGVDAGMIEPGKVATVEFVATEVGEFTFYCTMWCDRSHPRMRGTLEVRDPAEGSVTRQAPARDLALRELDAPREASAIPPVKPSAARGEPLYAGRCAGCHGNRGQGTSGGMAVGRREFLWDRKPIQVFEMLAGGTVAGASGETVRQSGAPLKGGKGRLIHDRYSRGWSDQDRWDAVAYLWSLGSTPGSLDLGRRLYLKNCAACHGESGAGDGPGGRAQPKAPANFTNGRTMLAGTVALYTAKIRRGGMGTGMPYWGSIFTEEELAALVDSLWTFSLGAQD